MESIDIRLSGNKMVIKANPIVLKGIYNVLVKSIKDSQK